MLTLLMAGRELPIVREGARNILRSYEPILVTEHELQFLSPEGWLFSIVSPSFGGTDLREIVKEMRQA